MRCEVRPRLSRAQFGGIQLPGRTEDTGLSGHQLIQGTQDTEDTEDIQDTQDTEDTQDTQDTEEIRMSLSKVGNQTSSQDPQAVNSR